MAFKKALIDGDILVYRVGFATENEPLNIAISRMRQIISSWRKLSEAPRYKGYLTGDGNYRTTLAKTLPYKGQRVAPKPLHYQALRDFLQQGLGFEMAEGQEADDLLGIALRDDPDGSIVLTLDKDLNNVPGWHLNPVGDPQPTFITVNQAVVNFGRQVLTGDATDNVPGVYKHFGHLVKPSVKIGPVRAAHLLPDDTPAAEVWDQVIHAYSLAAPKGASYETLHTAALETAQLVWIRWEKDQLFTPEYLKGLNNGS